jgi:hypothetical protein
MNTKPIHTELESDSPVNERSEQIELPKPDSENITVFTHNLPNKPILPWNHYDSPWEETNDLPQGVLRNRQDEDEQKQTQPPEVEDPATD